MNMVDRISCGQGRALVKPIVLTAISNVVELAPFACVALIVASVVEGDIEASRLWAACGVMGIFLVATFIFEHLAITASFSDGYKLSAKSRIRLAEHIRKLPLGTLDEAGQASITNSLMSDVATTERGMTHVLPQVASGIVVVVVGSVALAFVDVRLAVAAFLGLPISVAALACGRGLRRRGDARMTRARVEVAASLQDLLYGIEPAKALPGSGAVTGRIVSACEEYRDACIAQERATGALNHVASMALRLSLAVVFVVGGALVASGSVSVEVLVLFLMVGTRMYDPLSAALMNWAELETAARAGERVLDILGQEPLPGEGDISGSDLACEDVTFSYGNARGGADAASAAAGAGEASAPARPAVAHVSLEAQAGRRIALVGPSGSGKSTVLKLAARFYDPDAGVVRLGGADVSQASPEGFYRNVSMVFQDVYLFHDTVENNIRYGREDATHEEVVAAAAAARCHEFIEQMPQGYQTMLGERGSTLSGGERQRIAIARALLKDAPVVLIDEATSALDPINEREVQRAISALLAGRTVIMIAHNLHSVRDVDEIVVLDGGRVRERGTHDELVRADGLYAHLWRTHELSGAWQVA